MPIKDGRLAGVCDIGGGGSNSKHGEDVSGASSPTILKSRPGNWGENGPVFPRLDKAKVWKRCWQRIIYSGENQC